MNRYKLLFEYDGTDFSGWQKQPSGRTVEGEIEGAFSRFYQFDVNIIGQGRTDAGVHAAEQVAHVDLPDHFSTDKIVYAMKGLLPNDIALHSVSRVSNNFHARFDAVSRRYLYNILLLKSPLSRRFGWEITGNPDFKILHELSHCVAGTHDFINFCVPADDKHQTTLCTISESKWEIRGNQLEYHIEGNRFLRHMVRRLVGCMIQIATGKTRKNVFMQLLEGGENNKKAFSAPSKGLILTKVLY